MRARSIILASACLPLLLAAGGKLEKPAVSQNAVELQMQNVNIHLDRSVMLDIRRLRGQMIPAGNSQPITLDDVNSFTIRISSAEIAITAKTMSDLLNNYVFAYPHAPLKNIQLTVQNGAIKQTGTMHKGIDLPFEIEGSLDVTPDGQIKLHAQKIRSAHLPFKGLLHLFGEDLSKLVNLKQDRGVRLEGDDIILNPSRILPPPHITGKVTAVRVEGDSIVEIFDSQAAKPLAPPYQAKNYIYHRGGVLRFGKLTMHDADLEIVDLSPGNVFDFSLPEYNRQLVAGYSKNTPDHGLIVFMPDFRSLASAAPHHPAAPSQSKVATPQTKAK